MKNNSLLKPYNIVYEGDEGATIDMYGEVVETRPVDWWTGETIPGNFIVLDEFLNDLKDLEGKSTVTVHINSVGGSFYAGLAIYNRLRSLGAKITTINDSLAASAGSIIFMAGDTRKVNAGSTLMVHSVMGFLYGYYNVGDLKNTIKTLQAHDKALVAVYKEATGLDEETIRTAIAKDTYMTGQEAVDAGWADVLIGGDDEENPVNMKLSPDKSRVMVNGHAVAACLFGKLPENIQMMTEDEWAEMSTPKSGEEPHNTGVQPAPQVDENTHLNGGTKMDIKNIDDLRNTYGDLVSQIVADAQATAIQNERNRISAIEEIEASIGDAELVKNAKYGENPMTAEQLAYAAMKAQAAIGANMIDKMQTDANNGGANAVTGASAPKDELTDDEKAVNLLLNAINKKEGN
jgi:ATP-dependent protease ClpP protease subunit